MSSDPKIRGRLRRALAVGAMTLLFAGACGKKGDPQPPPSKRPAPAEDLVVEQRGEDLVLRFSYPTTTLGGLALPGVEAIEVWRLAKITLRDDRGEPLVLKLKEEPEEGSETVEEGAQWPADLLPEDLQRLTPVGSLAVLLVPRPEPPLPKIDRREFEASAEPWMRLAGEDLQTVVVGDRIVITVPISEAIAGLPEDPLADAALAQGLEVADLDLDPEKIEKLPTVGLGIKTFSTDGRDSPLNAPVVAVPATAPPAPIEFEVEPSDDGVILYWQPPEGLELFDGFNLYRRPASVRTYVEPLLGLLPAGTQVKDKTAVYGERYIYTLTTVARRKPLLESRISTEHEVDYQDRFPPPVPRRLVALNETGRVRLLWQAVESTDLAGYLIYRRLLDEEEARPLEDDPTAEPEYIDTSGVPGRTYVYEIRSVDLLGNVSEASQAVEVRVR